MSALKLCNPMVFGVGMIADNLSLHASMIARAHISDWQLLWSQQPQLEADVTTELLTLILAQRYRARPGAGVLMGEGWGAISFVSQKTSALGCTH
jgi:hypothetical protein